MHTLGYISLFLAWAYGVVVAGWSVRRWGERRDPAPMGVALVGGLGLGAVAVSLTLPWVSGTAAGTDARLVLAGWTGLDPLSVAGVVLLALPTGAYLVAVGRGGQARRPIRTAQALCLLGLLGGNALIQLAPETATGLAVGGPVGVAGALVLLASTLADRPVDDHRGPASSRPAAAAGRR